MSGTFISELRRRGVLGALIAYGVAAAGGLQLADIVVHAMDLPAWSMRLMIWLAVIGLPVTFVVSWFWDLTRRGFVRTEGPIDRAPTPGSPRPVTPTVTQPAGTAAISTGSLLAGRYRIERELGAGGMGKVYAAQDARLGRRVAVKVVLGAHEPARIRRFEQEAQTAGSLEHPNVLAVYDLGEEAGVPFLVTELLEGHTLRTLLASGPLPADQALGVGLQLARGLAAAHARGVIHRDLKPENLFVTSDGRLKILDFGLAKLVGGEGDTPAGAGLTVTGAIFGTPGYISPEQARGEAATASSDVFAAGAVLYEILTGHRAFPGKSLIEAGHAALTRDPPPLPPTVPASLDAVVRRALEKDPAQRFKDAGELARALEAPGSIAPSAITAAPTQQVDRPRRTRRSTAVVAGATVIALFAAVWSGALVRKRNKAEPGWSPRDLQQLRDLKNRRLPPIPPVPPGMRVEVTPNMPASPNAPAEPDDEDQPDPDEISGAVAEAHSHAGEIGIVTGVHQLYGVGMTDRAEKLIGSWIQSHPDQPYTRLTRFWLLRRMGRAEEAQREIRDFVGSHAGDNDWPMPIARVYAGTRTPDQLFDEAQRVRGDPRSRMAEAFYYVGMLYATAAPPDTARARAFFEKVLALRTRDVETGFAREELSALDRGR